MASKTGEKWLIFSYAANLDGMAASQHLDDRLPHFQSQGITPILLSGVCGVASPGVDHLRIPSMAPSGIRFESRYWWRRRVTSKPLRSVLSFLTLWPVLILYVIEKIFLNLESQWSWFILASWRGKRICHEQEISVIYSTGGSASAHVAASKVARSTGIPWMAEFQDPLVHPAMGRNRRSVQLYERVERLVAMEATRVVFLTEEARRRFDKRTGGVGKCCVIYPGSNPRPLAPGPHQRAARCRFAHAGTLAGSRNLRGFLAGLELVLKRHPEWKEQIEVRLYGHMDGGMRTMVQEFPFANIVHDFGRLPRLEALQAMGQCDVLLLVQNAEDVSRETIPSKVYEYLFAGRPVFGLIYDNPELRGLLVQHGHLAREMGDSEGVRDDIEYMVEQWRNNFTSLKPSPHSSLTVRAAVTRLVEEMRMVVTERKSLPRA